MTSLNNIDRLVAEARQLLSTAYVGRQMTGVETIGSTNEEGVRLAEQGCIEGHVVIANHQTAGRGRFNRQWIDADADNLLFSLILFPEISHTLIPLLGLSAALAVSETIESVVPDAKATIKWPNDVLIGERKTCGILLESRRRSKNKHPSVILGIGLNVNQKHFPQSLEEYATSLRLASGVELDRARVLAGILNRFELHYESLKGEGYKNIVRHYQKRMMYLDQAVRFTYGAFGSSTTGILLGIDDTGSLRLRIDEKEQTFHAGEITFNKN